MTNIIFSKYSNDRNVYYKIRTDIYEDEAGKRHVRKVAMSAEARKHIKNMYDLYCKMKEQFQEGNFSLNQSELSEDTLELEYLQGETLEEHLDGLLERKDYDAFSRQVKNYAENVRRMATEDFAPCESYFEVFGGEADDGKGQYSMSFSDIDMVFANLISQKEGWTVCDYEWTFRFSVPVDFILFRTIHYYVTPNRKKDMGDIDLYELMGVGKNKLTVYEKMEQSFQQYVTKNNKPVWKLYDTMKKDVYFPQGMAIFQAMKKQFRFVEIVKYYEDEIFVSEKFDLKPDAKGNVRFHIDVDDKVKTVRIDPAAQKCIVKINKITGIAGEEYEIQYGCNGTSRDNRIICFDTDDPQIFIGDIREGLSAIEVDYVIEYSDHLMENLCEVVEDYNNIRGENIEIVKQILDKDKQLQEADKLLSSLEQHISNMEQSISWKVTKPLRTIKKSVVKRKNL